MTTTGRRMLGFWVAAVVAGGLLAIAVQETLNLFLYGLAMRFVTSASIHTLDSTFFAIQVVVIVASAIAIAVPPAFVLGRRLAGIELPWIVASAVAALFVVVTPAGGWVEDWSARLMGGPTALIPLSYGLVAGFVAGVAQAIVLKPHVRGVGWWIPASTLAGAIVNLAEFLMRWEISGGGLTTQTEIYFMEIVIGAIAWLIVGILTGLVLVRLLGELHPERTRVVT